MATEMHLQDDPLSRLNRAFILNHPRTAARSLEHLPAEEAAAILQQQEPPIAARVLERIAPGTSDILFLLLPREVAAPILVNMEASNAVALLSRQSKDVQKLYLDLMNEVSAAEFRSLLEYPENSIGRLMSTRIVAFNRDTTVAQAITKLRQMNLETIHHLFLLDDAMRLDSEVEIKKLALAEDEQKLSSIAKPITAYVNAMDPRDELMDKLDKFHMDVVPVVDIELRLVGVVRAQGLMEALREDIVTDMQTMVGASKDERALSTSLFAVRKRLPWLQINLLTAFLAAAVVGLFEDTISRFTALAILLPIAAGQSGNAGAQALAVTMRGLTLREITMGHWVKVMMKELKTGFINGIGIAVTCSAGVYLWSRSPGLSLVMAIAMIISMTIAGIAGALVPILLKRFGMDPAQSSSIVLTTITDIAGFMSFLGTATVLASLLEAG
ncbi:MAG: magnesium transporter [Pseudomonadales bacterium]|nr:magnesium transporter [Pseudomonadales bacterium]